MLALGIYEAGVGDCGFHHDLTGDRRNHFTFESSNCSVCAAAERWSRMQNDADSKMLERYGDDGPPPDMPLPSDGRRTYIRQMDPREVSAAPAT